MSRGRIPAAAQLNGNARPSLARLGLGLLSARAAWPSLAPVQACATRHTSSVTATSPTWGGGGGCRLRAQSGGGFEEEPTARRAHRAEGATVRRPTTRHTVPANGAGRGGNATQHSPATRAQRLRARWRCSTAARRLLR
jgi:hypothetical protein